ncbi:protein BTG3-like [Rhopilema esculentum]|uniref:protein BTG3-like n=1 Tax=Rhopilema esculentum TaxID=499914 RepID=UPI0031DDEB10|eukprot:gene16472-7888_t
MKDEVTSAAQFICGKLKENYRLNNEQCERFKTNLEELMLQRFQNHWHPEKPLKGNAYRCININHVECVLDPMLKDAAVESFISIDELKATFPDGLALWVDPYDVSYRMGRRAICPIFKRYNPNKPQASNRQAAKVPRYTTHNKAAGQRPNSGSDVVLNSKLNTSAPSFVPASQANQDFSSTWTKTWQTDQQRRDHQSNQGFYSYFQVNPDQGIYNRFHWHREDEQPQQAKKMQSRGFEFRNVAQEAY